MLPCYYVVLLLMFGVCGMVFMLGFAANFLFVVCFGVLFVFMFPVCLIDVVGGLWPVVFCCVDVCFGL